jgi:hypothetical protein
VIVAALATGLVCALLVIIDQAERIARLEHENRRLEDELHWRRGFYPPSPPPAPAA